MKRFLLASTFLLVTTYAQAQSAPISNPGAAPTQKSLIQYGWLGGDILAAENRFIADCNVNGRVSLFLPAGVLTRSVDTNPWTGIGCDEHGAGPGATTLQVSGTVVQWGNGSTTANRVSLHDLAIQYLSPPAADTPAIYAMNVTDHFVYNIKFINAGKLERDGSATTRATRGYHWGWTGDYNQGTAENCNIEIINASAEHYWHGTLSGSVTSGSPTNGNPVCVQPQFNGVTPGLTDTGVFQNWWMQATSAGYRAGAVLLDSTQGNINNETFDGDVFDWSGTSGFTVKCTADQASTSAATGAGAVLMFSSIPANVIVGMYVYDTTTGGVIPIGTQVQSLTSTMVTLTGNVAGGGVLSGDNIVFGGVGYIHNLTIVHTRVTPGLGPAHVMDYNCGSTTNGLDAENIHVIDPKLLTRDGSIPFIVKQAHNGGTAAYTNATLEDADIMSTGTAAPAAVEIGASNWYLKSGMVARYGGTGASPNIANLLQVDGSPSNLLVGKWQLHPTVTDNSGHYSTQQQPLSIAINGVQVANTTKYYPVCCGWMSSISANENVVGQKWSAGMLTIPSDCGADATAPGVGQTEIFTIRIAGATPANPITCTFSETSTAGVGTGGPNTVTDGQLIDWRAVQSLTSIASSPTIRAMFGHQ